MKLLSLSLSVYIFFIKLFHGEVIISKRILPAAGCLISSADSVDDDGEGEIAIMRLLPYERQ